ncbi:hypothetical protein ABPG72_002584 [Tetrahymena utriculariae]
MDSEYEKTYTIMRNVLFLVSKNTQNIMSQRNMLNKWFQDSIKNYILEQTASPLIANYLKCHSSAEVKTYIHNRTDKNRPKYMSIIEQYFFYIKKYNLGNEFMERLKNIIKNPIIITESTNYKTYNLKKMVRKQFVVYLILRYYELYGKQEIPSFYELWNICFPDEIQQKKKLSKYDTMNRRKPKNNSLIQNQNTSITSCNLQNKNHCSYQMIQNQEHSSFQAYQRNYNFDYSQGMGKENTNYTYHPFSQVNQLSNQQQETFSTTPLQVNNCYLPQARFEGNIQHNSCQFPYPTFSSEQLVQKQGFPFPQNFQNEYNQPHLKLEENMQHNQMNNSGPFNSQQSAQNFQTKFNESFQAQFNHNTFEVKSEQAEQWNAFPLPPLSSDQLNNQKIESSDQYLINIYNPQQPQVKFEGNEIINSATINQQNIKIQEPQSIQNSHLLSNSFSLPQVKFEDNQQRVQNTNFFCLSNKQQNEKKEEFQSSEIISEIYFNSLQSQLKLQENYLKNLKTNLCSTLNSQLIVQNQEAAQSFELKNHFLQPQIKIEESQQNNDSTNYPKSSLSSSENIKIQESPIDQIIQNELSIPFIQVKYEEIKQKTNIIKLNLSIKSLQNTKNQSIAQETVKIQESQSIQSLQNQNNLLQTQVKSEENATNECKLKLNLFLNNEKSIHNNQMSSEDIKIQENEASNNIQNESNLHLPQVKQEKNKNNNINEKINISQSNNHKLEIKSQNLQNIQIKNNCQQPQIKIEQIDLNKFKMNICQNFKIKQEEPLFPQVSQIKSNYNYSHAVFEQNQLNYDCLLDIQQNTINQQYSFGQSNQANNNFQQTEVKLEEKHSLSNNFLYLNSQKYLQNQQPSSSQQCNKIFYNHLSTQAQSEENPQPYSNLNLNIQQKQITNLVKEEKDKQIHMYPSQQQNSQEFNCKKEESLNDQNSHLINNQTNQIPFIQQNQQSDLSQEIIQNIPQRDVNQNSQGHTYQHTNSQK